MPRVGRSVAVGAVFFSGAVCLAQGVATAGLPSAPSALLTENSAAVQGGRVVFSSSDPADLQNPSATGAAPQAGTPRTAASPTANDAGEPQQAGAPKIRPETGRIFGIFPNFVAVSGGTKPKPAGWKTDFHLANKQAYDYSSFGFLLLSSGFAYWDNSHPSLNTVNGGNAIFYAYLWRGFLDKTDGSYQGTFFFPALLHEDTRYYAMGTGPVKKRLLHAVESVVVAHNYSGQPTINAAGLIGRAGAQAVSTTYYPAGSEGFGVLAEKYGYSTMRNVIYAVVREFSPDAQAHVHLRKGAETQ